MRALFESQFATTLQNIRYYEQIETKNEAIYRKLSTYYRSLATAYFNAEEYALAADNYIKSIETKQQIKILNDADFRLLIFNFIDLSDAFLWCNRQSEAEAAMQQAIQIFPHIKNKFAGEKNIGDPAQNFKKFREYYENITSLKPLLGSVEFQNHAKMLHTAHEEQELMKTFDSLQIDTTSIENNLVTMMKKLDIAPGNTSFTTAFFMPGVPEDEHLRRTTGSYLELARMHNQKGDVASTRKTCEQALGAIRAIKNPVQSDIETIQQLEWQIQQINNVENTPKETPMELN